MRGGRKARRESGPPGSGSADSDGTLSSYAWDFGEGSTGSGVASSHVYSADGSNTATLRATDDDGATASATSAVTNSDSSASLQGYADGTLMGSMRLDPPAQPPPGQSSRPS
jgi:PKD repeat protein